MSNEDELNPNLTTNNNLTNLYTDSTPNTTASLFPPSSLNQNNNEIVQDQTNELSNLFQNGPNETQLNNDDGFITNNENDNLSTASTLFNTSSEIHEQTNQNIQNYYNDVEKYDNHEPQYYQQQQNITPQMQDSTQNSLIQQQNTFNEQQQHVQETFSQQQQVNEAYLQQQAHEAFIQQQQIQAALIQQQNSIQSPQSSQQNDFNQQNTYYQQPYYSTPINPNNQYENSTNQQITSTPPQQQAVPYGTYIPPQQVQPPPPITQQPQQFNYSNQTNFQAPYQTTQSHHDHINLKAYSSSPVKIGIPPPPKGPSPTYFTPLTPGEAVARQPQQQPQIYSPKRMFVPSSPNSQQQQQQQQQQSQQKNTAQIQQLPRSSNYTSPQTRQSPPPPITTLQQPQTQQQQTSPRSPGTPKRGPVFVAPYIPGQTAPTKIITSIPPPPQQQNDQENTKFRPPPPIQQPPKPTPVTTAPPTIQPPPPNTFVPPPQIQNNPIVQQKQQQIINDDKKFQMPPPMPSTVQTQPPPMAKPPPPVSKGPIYVPGQGRINSSSASTENSTTTEQTQSNINHPTSQTQNQPLFNPPPPLPTIPQPAKTSPYIPGLSNQQGGPTKGPYIPGQSNQQADTSTSTSTSFFTPHETSQTSQTSSSTFMKPPPMPIPLPVGIPVTRPPEEKSNKTRRRKKKTTNDKDRPREAFEPSPVPHFMTPEAVASRGNALPHSQTTGDVSIDEKGIISEYEYEYEYENEENCGVKHSVSEPKSVVPIIEPFFSKKKPVTALGFGGLVLSRKKDKEDENGDDNSKKNNGFVNISKICQNSGILSVKSNGSEKEEFVSNQISKSKEDEQKFLWATVKVFLEVGSNDISSEDEIKISSVLQKFRDNLRKEGTSESELLKLLSTPKSDEIEEEEEKDETIKKDSKSEEDKFKLLEEVQSKITQSGEESALDFAIQNEIWPVALIISSSLSTEASQKTIEKYIESELKSDKGKHLNNLSSALCAISGIENENFDPSKWKLKLREILLHLTNLSQKTSLVKMASVLESNKLGYAALACRIIENLHLAAKISFFSSHVTSRKSRREAQRCYADFCSFIQSIIEDSPASLNALQVAIALVSEKVDNEKLMMNLSFLNAAASSDFGLESKSKEDLEYFKNVFDGKDDECFTFAKRFLENLNRLNEKVSDESIKVVPLRKEDLPPPPKPETESNNFFVPMAALIPGLSSTSQQPPSNQTNPQNQPSFFSPNSSSSSQSNHPTFFTPAAAPSLAPQNRPNQPSFFTPNQSNQSSNHPQFFTPNSSSPQNPVQQRSSPINLYPKNNNYDNYEDNMGNEINDNIDTTTTKSTPTPNKPTPVAKNETEPQSKSTDSQQKQPQQDNQQKRGWFSGFLSKINPFGSSSKVVDLSLHDNGEMVWNGHRYVMKGHENDDDSSNLPPPPPKGMVPIAKSKSSPFPTSQNSAPPPPGGSPVPPPPSGAPAPPVSTPMTGPPIGAVAPTGRTRVSKRYVANF